MATYCYGWRSGIITLSMLLAAEAYGQKPDAHAQRFSTDGLALVTVADRSFYIDSTGNRAFDAYENPNQPWSIPANGAADTTVFVVVKDGLKGLRSEGGKWMLEPVYQQIEYLFETCWKVTKGGKQTITTPTGDQLPYFDEVGYLDGRYFDVKTEGKWGLYDRESQKLTTPAVYDGFDYCGGCGRKSDYIYAQQNGKWGIIDFNNNIRVAFAYEHSHWGGMRSDVWVRSFTKNGNSLVIHIPSGKEFVAVGDDRPEILSGGELVVAANGKYGLIDTFCQEILPPVYERITTPNDNDYRGYFGPYVIVEKDGKKGIYESGHGLIIQPKWDDARVYDNYFALSRGGQYGLYDHEGGELLAPSFTDITHINDYFYSSGSEGLAVFKTKQQALYGIFFAETGTEVTPRFHEIDLHAGNYDQDATLIVGERLGEEAVFDFDGHELLPRGYEEWGALDTVLNRYIKIKKNGLWGAYDTSSKTEVLPPTFGSYNEVAGIAGLFSDDRQGGNAILVDGRNGQQIPLPTPHATPLSNTALVMISADAKQGRLYHPFEKRTVSDMKFAYPYNYTPDSRLASLGEFSPNGLAWVNTGGQYGLMDTTGRWVKEPFYDSVLPFGERSITVGAKAYPASDWRNHVGYVAYQFIGLDGEPVTGEVYTGPNEFLMDVDYFSGGYLIIREFDAKTGALTVGLADTTGNVVLPPAYDAVEAFGGNRYLLLQSGHKFGVADGSGDVLLPVEFDNLLLDRYDKETGITFPLLGYREGEWRYYTKHGHVLPVEGVGDDAWSVTL